MSLIILIGVKKQFSKNSHVLYMRHDQTFLGVHKNQQTDLN